MKVLFLFLNFIILNGCSPKIYERFFTEKRFRFDYKISGTSSNQEITPVCVKEEKFWGGSRVNLLDTFQYGEYLLKIYNQKSNQLIYSRGFSDLFSEWQTTAEAKEKEKSYMQTVIFPAPKETARLEIHKRDSSMKFRSLYKRFIDPQSDQIIKDEIQTTSSKILHQGDNYTKALDIVILSEGYTANEEAKFFQDAGRFKEYLFSWEPYTKNLQHINFTAVFAASQESGVDIPSQNVWVTTNVDAHFNTFGIERYLTLPDLTKVHDYLSEFPMDQVVVIANSEKYGGGGMYNFYTIFTSDNALGERLFLHEFGHGFASLGDEYFNSEVAYESFGGNTHEPFEPNITNLVNFESKWKDMIPDSIPIPTPDESEYDSCVGVFEGANYVSKGYYRPYRDCAMRSSTMNYFCPVCIKSIEEMIDFYSK